MRTHLHLYQAGEFHDAVTYIRLAFVPWEIEIPGSVRLSAARGSSMRRTHVVAHTSNISRRMVQIMCLRYLAGASERGALGLPVLFPRVSTSDSVRRVHIARPSFVGMTGVYWNYVALKWEVVTRG